MKQFLILNFKFNFSFWPTSGGEPPPLSTLYSRLSTLRSRESRDKSREAPEKQTESKNEHFRC